MATVPSKRFANDMAKSLYHWFIRNGQTTERCRDRNGDEWFANYHDGKISVFRMKDGYETAIVIEPKKTWA